MAYPDLHKLSDRHMRALEYVSQGHSITEAALQFGISRQQLSRVRQSTLGAAYLSQLRQERRNSLTQAAVLLPYVQTGRG